MHWDGLECTGMHWDVSEAGRGCTVWRGRECLWPPGKWLPSNHGHTELNGGKTRFPSVLEALDTLTHPFTPRRGCSRLARAGPRRWFCFAAQPQPQRGRGTDLGDLSGTFWGPPQHSVPSRAGDVATLEGDELLCRRSSGCSSVVYGAE